MQNSVVFKPNFWRLLLWYFVPIYIGAATANIITKGGNRFTFLETVTATLVLTTILFLIFRKQYDIVISERKISGLAAGFLTFMGRETFPIDDVDLSQIHRQTPYEKINLYYTIRSKNKQKIMVIDFIYDTLTLCELYKFLDKECS